ncbi:ATP-binding protein [Nocardia fluminea]|uniref:ATP-binding protein n=1 Tax=Nocardia fluminea TaxID=134984 RepID=UPI00118002C6|nr:ATP-binding protein [Nocardia fluminea]
MAKKAVLHDWEVTEAFILSSLDARDRRDGVERDEQRRQAELKRLKRQYDEVAPLIPAAGVTAVSGSAPLPDSGDTPHSALRRLRSWSRMSVRDLAREGQIARSTLADKLSGKSVLTSQEVYSIAFACVQAHQPDAADEVANRYVEHHRSRGEETPRGPQLPAPLLGDEVWQRDSGVAITPSPEVAPRQTPGSDRVTKNRASLSAPVPPGFGSAAGRVANGVFSAVSRATSGRTARSSNPTQAMNPGDSTVDPALFRTRKDFAAELNQLRLRNGGMSIRTIATRTRTPAGTIAGWFAGTSLPRPDSPDFTRILTVLGEADRYTEWCKAAARLVNVHRQETGPSPAGGPSPYSDSRERDEWSTGEFFGRDALADRLSRIVITGTDRPTVVVVSGASGSGKTSLVRGALLPALAGRAAAEVVTVRPHDPHGSFGEVIDALAMHTAATASEDRGVLVIDQFEILMQRQDKEPGQWARLVEHVQDCASTPGRILVVVVRSDYTRRWMEQCPVRSVVFEIEPPTSSELTNIITGPAARTGVQVDPALVSHLLEELHSATGYETAGVAVVTVLLRQMWHERSTESMLTFDDYIRLGGIRAVLARRAEHTYDRFGPQQQIAARRILLRTIEIGETSAMRRTVAREELRWPDLSHDVVEDAISALARTYILVAGDSGIHLSSEALIPGWNRLNTWISSDRMQLRRLRRLIDAATDWESGGREPTHTLSSAQVSEFVALPAEIRANFGEREIALLIASQEQHERSTNNRIRQWISKARPSHDHSAPNSGSTDGR